MVHFSLYSILNIRVYIHIDAFRDGRRDNVYARRKFEEKKRRKKTIKCCIEKIEREMLDEKFILFSGLEKT